MRNDAEAAVWGAVLQGLHASPPPPPHSSSLESVVPGSGQAVVPSVYLCLGPKHSTIPVVYTLGTPFVGTALGYQELTKDAPIRF